jgi:O-antigen/teichoic acid export membrane protein
VTSVQEDQENNGDSAPSPRGKPSLLNGATWLLSAKTLAFAITTALPFLLVRRLPQTEYGYYKQLFVLLQSAMNYLPFGMNMSLFYFLPRVKKREERGNVILVVLIFYLCTTGFAGGCLIVHPAFVDDLFHSLPLTALGRQIGFVLIPYVIGSLFEIILVANDEIRSSAMIIVLMNILRTLLILGAVLIWGTIAAILCAVAISLVFQCIWLFTYLLRRFGRFWKHFRLQLLLAQLSYALPLGLAGLLWSLQMDLHNYFVSHYFNAAKFAIYSVGCFQLPLVGILGDSVGSVLIPRISHLQSENSIAEIVSLTAKAMRGLAAIYAPLFAFMFVTATPFITLLFRRDYIESVPIFRINLLMVLLAIVAVDPIVRAFMTERFWMMKLNIALFAAMVAILPAGIKWFGLAGAIACVVTVQYVARILITWRVSRLLGVGWKDMGQFRDLGKILIAASAAGICILFLLAPLAPVGALGSLVVCSFVFGAVYLGVLILLRVPTQSEIQWIRTWKGPF